MAKSTKLVAVKRGKVLLVRRKRDHLWMFPGGRKRASESEKDCLRREISEELPKLKIGKLALWKDVEASNRFSGRKMSDAIFIGKKASGTLRIGDKKDGASLVGCGLRPRRVTSGQSLSQVQAVARRFCAVEPSHKSLCNATDLAPMLSAARAIPYWPRRWLNAAFRSAQDGVSQSVARLARPVLARRVVGALSHPPLTLTRMNPPALNLVESPSAQT
jgi:8-oxo-dGTP diphosphatase